MTSARDIREQYVGPWLPDPAMLPAEVVQRQESNTRKCYCSPFLCCFETLTPPEWAVFLLREALDFTYDTTASILGKPVMYCRQVFHRAQQRLARDTAVARRPFLACLSGG
jgi:RNA polymerase sigma-70 factor (ECF subfamily)